MPTLDDILNKPTEAGLSHPRLRNWAERIKQSGENPTLEVFRPTAPLGFAEPEMNLLFRENGKLLPLETLPWDDELNAGLVELKVRAVNPANEAERFALGLRAALRKAEREFGDGYFNGVLHELVTESDLTRDPEIHEIIKYAHATSPHRGSRSYDNCREMIAIGIAGRKAELERSLGYEPTEARKILVNALARYLDDRFSVSNLKRLGLI